jgi:aminopeptidase N
MKYSKCLDPGGAWRIHMLRHLLGNDVFWVGVRLYVSRFMGRTVETEDFRHALEEVSGLNLTRFFDQWLYSKGYPKLQISMEHNKDADLVQFAVEQTQVDQKAGIGLFSFDLDLEIVDDKGGFHRGQVVFDYNTRATTSITIPKDTKPLQVRVDPLHKVLFTLDFKPSEEILIETARQGDVFSRIWAYRELINIGTYQIFKKVKDLVTQEKAARVRERGTACHHYAGGFFFFPLISIIVITHYFSC